MREFGRRDQEGKGENFGVGSKTDAWRLATETRGTWRENQKLFTAEGAESAEELRFTTGTQSSRRKVGGIVGAPKG